jgi:hypothetical protein
VGLKRAIVVDVAASPARWTEEVATTSVMVERTRCRFGLTPSRLAADAAGFRQYRAKPASCGPCSLKPRCTSGTARLIGRNVHEDEREHVRQLAANPEFKRSARERRKVEMLFAHLKRNLGLRRLRLRGPTGAGDEFLLAATAQNLRRLARSLTAPPPTSATAPV